MKALIVSLVLLSPVTFAEPSPIPSPAATSTMAYAEFPVPVVDTSIDPPKWLKSAVVYGESVPVVGPVVVEAMKWLGVIASIFTALATAFFAIAQILTRAFNLAGLVGVANAVSRFYVKWSPIIQYLSVYNVQKKKETPPA